MKQTQHNRTQYFTRSSGEGVCLWRVTHNGHTNDVTLFGKITEYWGPSMCLLEDLKQSVSMIQVTRNQARKWYPSAFRKPFNAGQ